VIADVLSDHEQFIVDKAYIAFSGQKSRVVLEIIAKADVLPPSCVPEQMLPPPKRCRRLQDMYQRGAKMPYQGTRICCFDSDYPLTVIETRARLNDSVAVATHCLSVVPVAEDCELSGNLRRHQQIIRIEELYEFTRRESKTVVPG
jgi:hypothetical protein